MDSALIPVLMLIVFHQLIHAKVAGNVFPKRAIVPPIFTSMAFPVMMVIATLLAMYVRMVYVEVQRRCLHVLILPVLTLLYVNFPVYVIQPLYIVYLLINLMALHVMMEIS